MMADGTPVANMTLILGLGVDYLGKIVRNLAREHNVDYKPVKVMSKTNVVPFGITDASRRLRSALADRIHALGDNRFEIAMKTGVLIRHQGYARERPFNHDWTLSQLERLAAANETDFTWMMLSCLLEPAQYEKVMQCLSR